MLDVANLEHDAGARAWIFRNATAASSNRRDDGSYGRFFDGPPPAGTVTAWQTSGAFAAEIGAASLAPSRSVGASQWTRVTTVRREIARMPAKIRFHGSGIAVFGTIGENCCESGHARVFVDGTETVNRIGLWQNKSSSGVSLPKSVLFAWRWRKAANHSVTFAPGTYDAKEGGAFLHVRSYEILDTSPRDR